MSVLQQSHGANVGLDKIDMWQRAWCVVVVSGQRTTHTLQSRETLPIERFQAARLTASGENAST